ncbi:BAR-domain-containing protein [Xylariaceae sp. FL0804]|nr:BAR-domain-containing protein [Xylariaceae sp. FL0804]
MNFTKKIDRAFQWAGEKMGQEAKTSHTDEFRMLETEMALRHDGMDRLQKSMTAYVKSISRRSETFEDKEKGLPVSYLGRTMMSHGEDFEPDSEFGTSLIAMGRANERIAGIQETYVAHATSYWLEGLERSLAMMKEYQASRKKLEHRRLTYDANMTKMQKAKREDFRLEEELRASKAKYDESSEDVYRRMQDVKEAEADSVRDLTSFLDAELDYYERCAAELRRTRQEWTAGSGQGGTISGARRGRAQSNFSDRSERTERWASSRPDPYEQREREREREQQREPEPAPEPVRMPIRASRYHSSSYSAAPEPAPRPYVSRSSTYGGAYNNETSPSPPRPSSYREPPPPPPPQSQSSSSSSWQQQQRPSVVPAAAPSSSSISSLRGNLRPVSRIQTNGSLGNSNLSPDVFADDYDTATSNSGGSPRSYNDRAESPATSYGSLSRSASNTALRAAAPSSGGGSAKKPPPPPPSRSKKPPPPIPAKRDMAY